MSLTHRHLVTAVAAVCLLLASTLARADVRDNAKIFSQGAVDKANAAMAEMQRKHNRSFVVETFPAIPDELQDQYQQQGKEAFFRDWLGSRARALQANGVFALVNMDPRYVEANAGKNTKAAGSFTDADVARLRAQMVAAFKQQQFDQGLLQAVDLVERAYTANINSGVKSNSAVGAGGAAGTPGAPVPQNQPTGRSSSPWPGTHHSSGMGIGSIICLGIGVLLIVSLVRSLFRRQSSGYGSGANYGGGPNPNYPPGGGPGYGAPGYGPGYGGGGGFGRGLLGGLFGGMLGGYAADRFMHRNDQNSTGGTSSYSSPPDTGTSGLGGGWDAGPSDAGQGFDSGGSGGDFGGGGGDMGGGGGDSGGSGGDF